MKLKKLAHGKSSAQAMVEFAIALPILLMLLYGILEAGRLLFLYSTVVTASRQAVRYGATTGSDTDPVLGTVVRYQYCKGIRAAANRSGYLGPFDAITLQYDSGPGSGPTPYCGGSPLPDTDSNLNAALLQGNSTRLVVTVTEQFVPLVPKLVPFAQRNITATSARTILYSIPIVVEGTPIGFKAPTTTLITSHNPDPSAPGESVLVVVTVSNPTTMPTGTVDITGGDGATPSCQITLNASGTGSCSITFGTSGVKIITANYTGDADHQSSSDSKGHTVQLAETVTTITAHSPDPSVVNQNVTVSVTVTGGVGAPTGTVNVDAGGSVNCSITLSGGTGSCNISFNNTGVKTITASYNGDSTHNPSTSDPVSHTVTSSPPTPTATPTITPQPTITLTPTATLIPTITTTATAVPTAVIACNTVDNLGPVTKSGNSMNMVINNPTGASLQINDVTVQWNHDKGHQTGSDKTLQLIQASLGGVVFWTGTDDGSTHTIIPFPTTYIPPGNSTITFTFHQSYDNWDTTEYISITLSSPGCEGVVVIGIP